MLLDFEDVIERSLIVSWSILNDRWDKKKYTQKQQKVYTDDISWKVIFSNFLNNFIDNLCVDVMIGKNIHTKPCFQLFFWLSVSNPKHIRIHLVRCACCPVDVFWIAPWSPHTFISLNKTFRKKVKKNSCQNKYTLL